MAADATEKDHRVAVVLGAGGIVGVSYLIGALAALEEVGGFRGDDADLVVGTSAGAIVGSLLRSGVSASAQYRLALGQVDGVSRDRAQLHSRAHVDKAFIRSFREPVALVRRGVGSTWTIARAFGVVPGIVPTPPLSRLLFPSGLYTLDAVVDDLAAVFPEAWPQQPLYICACDLSARRRVVFGSPGAPKTSLALAVKASCAIPGFYESVTIGGRDYVDGGLLSTTNLDLADGYDLVIGVAPMAYDRHSARPSLHPARLAMEIYRRYPSRSLRSEMLAVRERGARVLLVRPTVFEAQRHGFNPMERRDRVKVAHKAYKTVARSLAAGRFAATLAEFGYGVGRSGSGGGGTSASERTEAAVGHG